VVRCFLDISTLWVDIAKKLRRVKTVRFCDAVVFEGESVRFTHQKIAHSIEDSIGTIEA